MTLIYGENQDFSCLCKTPHFSELVPFQSGLENKQRFGYSVFVTYVFEDFLSVLIQVHVKISVTSTSIEENAGPVRNCLLPKLIYDQKNYQHWSYLFFVSFSLFKVLVWHSLPLLKPFSSCLCLHCGQYCSSPCCCLLVLAVCSEYWRVFSTRYTIRSWFRCGRKYLQVNVYLVIQWFDSIT